MMKLDPTKPDDPLVWSLKDQGAGKAGVWATPALGDGVVYFATNGGRLLAARQGDRRDRLGEGPRVPDLAVARGGRRHPHRGRLRGQPQRLRRVRPTGRPAAQVDGEARRLHRGHARRCGRAGSTSPPAAASSTPSATPRPASADAPAPPPPSREPAVAARGRGSRGVLARRTLGDGDSPQSPHSVWKVVWTIPNGSQGRARRLGQRLGRVQIGVVVELQMGGEGRGLGVERPQVEVVDADDPRHRLEGLTDRSGSMPLGAASRSTPTDSRRTPRPPRSPGPRSGSRPRGRPMWRRRPRGRWRRRPRPASRGRRRRGARTRPAC